MYFYTVIQVLAVFSFIDIECTRKYDIEAESIKLYGKGIKDVIQSFRKTRQYIEILTIETENLSKVYKGLFQNLDNYYMDVLSARINETLNAARPAAAANEIQPNKEKERNETISRNLIISRTYVDKMPFSYLRTNENGSPEQNVTTLSPAKRLEEYYRTKTVMSAADKNYFRGLGYEIVGSYIHHLIKIMGKDKSKSFASTWSYDDEEATTTTTQATHQEKSLRQHTTAAEVEVDEDPTISFLPKESKKKTTEPTVEPVTDATTTPKSTTTPTPTPDTTPDPTLAPTPTITEIPDILTDDEETTVGDEETTNLVSPHSHKMPD